MSKFFSIFCKYVCISITGLIVSFSVRAELTYDGRKDFQKYIKLADDHVLSKISSDQKNILLKSPKDAEDYKKLGRSFKEKCESDSEPISCYFYARMTSNKDKKKEYMLKSCASGTLVSACLVQNILNYKEIDRPSGIDLDYGYCASGYDVYHCKLFFVESFKDELKNISKTPLYSLIEMMSNTSPYELDSMLYKGTISDTGFEQLEGFRSQISELLENNVSSPWFENSISSAGSDFSLRSLYELASFIDIILEGPEIAMSTLKSGCEINFTAKNREILGPGNLLFNCSSYINGVKDKAHNLSKDDLSFLKKYCETKPSASEACEFVVNHMDQKEAESFKLELCKINEYAFPDCKEAIDGF